MRCKHSFLRHIKLLGMGLLFLGFFLPTMTFAVGPINVRPIPSVPGPEMRVTVRVESFVYDIKAATIAWLLNGELVLEGRGATEYKFTTGKSGEESLFEVIITTPDGKNFKETLALRPASVDILWQAETYTPPFYKGKALPSQGSKIRAVAVPQFGDPQLLQYKWTANQSTGLAQGTGVSSAVMEAGRAGIPIALGVEVSSQTTSHKAARTVPIPSVAPEVAFYEDSPLYGIRFENVLSGTVMTAGPEYRILGVPYFFTKLDRDYGNLLYQWNINNRSVRIDGAQENLTVLKGEATGDTQHRIVLKIQNTKRPVKRSTQGFDILFIESNQ